MTRRPSRARAIINGWARLLPDRIAEEDIGDYLEDVQRYAEAGQQTRVWLRTAHAIVWTSINTIEFLVLRRLRQSQRQTATAMTDPQMSSAPTRNEVAGPLARTCGWLALGVALVCCALPVGIAIAVARDGIRPSPTPPWVLPLVFSCYLAFPVAFWCIGRGLLKGRVRLAAGGGLFLVGTLMTYLALFNTFD